MPNKQLVESADKTIKVPAAIKLFPIALPELRDDQGKELEPTSSRYVEVQKQLRQMQNTVRKQQKFEVSVKPM